MKIYMIMVATRCKIEGDKKLGFPEFGASTLVGYYASKEKAFRIVTHNCGDIWETCYDYAIIEEVDEGLYPCSMTRWFFKFNIETHEYKEIPEPEGFNHFCGIIV